jgi:hypothetical protein
MERPFASKDLTAAFSEVISTLTLTRIPPGVDVFCYSNGEDCVHGFRNAVRQTKAGRVVMPVDSAFLLNLHYLRGKDRAWERPYPLSDGTASIQDCDSVRRYGNTGTFAIVTYGNGVLNSSKARRTLWKQGKIANEDDRLSVS